MCFFLFNRYQIPIQTSSITKMAKFLKAGKVGMYYNKQIEMVSVKTVVH